MSLDLSYRSEQEELARSVDGLCRRCGTGAGFTDSDPLPEQYWRGLAELGVLGLGTAAGGGGALEIAACMEQLGAHGAPGPLVGTFTAGALLDPSEMEPISEGRQLASVGQPPLLPWAAQAGVFVEIDSSEAWLSRPVSAPEPVDTTAGEPWGRTELERLRPLGDATTAVALGQTAAAAYLAGAAQNLVEIASQYAKDRVQFNRPIATFQAISHPLASCSVAVSASRILARAAACALDNRDPDAPAAAARARLSATASATAAAYQAHQTFGAIGFTIEGPVAHVSLRIRQLSLQPVPQASARAHVLESLGI
ncbi:MAG: acyl-CoA dehydrogenase family protein [Acidimicrobiaceae bacterium]|nr:acyl-CoA dehydrogenase family protein [Acidimicrobiaceae bacterium]MCY3643095.1 acyl-CoA dehydrogenase family protein [Acidimicrobiaceae bacterium]MDE0494666.1 acyl-CoA dehydrogenase family protein [Acidimicrobiaceae bacterium]MYA14426.1 acyl-CoA dehydrogenase [Acidimicrobiaceae bacterium]MYE64468.1 acyl-CoA dehydrogenase [Acidimicrobiaceae bacterium]